MLLSFLVLGLGHKTLHYLWFCLNFRSDSLSAPSPLCRCTSCITTVEPRNRRREIYSSIFFPSKSLALLQQFNIINLYTWRWLLLYEFERVWADVVKLSRVEYRTMERTNETDALLHILSLFLLMLRFQPASHQSKVKLKTQQSQPASVWVCEYWRWYITWFRKA